MATPMAGSSRVAKKTKVLAASADKQSSLNVELQLLSTSRLILFCAESRRVTPKTNWISNMLTRIRSHIPCDLRGMLKMALITAPMLALCGAHGAKAEEIKIGGTGAALATMGLLADAYSRKHPEIKIRVLPSLGSGGGIKAVMTGAIQIAVSSRPLNEAELKAGAFAREYGRTPFVFATATTNKTAGLTTPELVSIFAGKTERWPDGKRIRLVLRPVGDSDSELIKNISPEMREAKSAAEQRQGMTFAVTDQDAADNIEKIAGAFGASTLAQIVSEKRPIKPLKLNNIEPSVKTLADGSYPLFKQFFIVTTRATQPEAQEFAAFIESAPGREILRKTGHWVK